MKQPIIFCDFDGTITENDNIIAVIKHFNPPGWEEIVAHIIEGRWSIKRGVGALFALLPSSQKQEIVRYSIENAKIRVGFQQLLDYCKQHHIEFWVTSGGIDFFVYPLLESFSIPTDQIYCNASDFSGENIRILWPHPCDEHCHTDCGMCKTTIIRRYPKDKYYRILIGDSVTDFEGSKLVDLIFARSHLETKCKELGLSYKPFQNFHDVIDMLSRTSFE